MIVYHASNQIVDAPDVKHSRRYLDFGQGFYVTPVKVQALNYSARFKVWGERAYLNIYEMATPTPNLRCKVFPHYDEEWLDFVAACRRGMAVEQFDIVEGGIADDRVYNTVDLYFSNQISKEEAIRRLVAIRPNQQICFLTQKAIDCCLTYLKTEDVR